MILLAIINIYNQINVLYREDIRWHFEGRLNARSFTPRRNILKCYRIDY